MRKKQQEQGNILRQTDRACSITEQNKLDPNEEADDGQLMKSKWKFTNQISPANYLQHCSDLFRHLDPHLAEQRLCFAPNPSST